MVLVTGICLNHELQPVPNALVTITTDFIIRKTTFTNDKGEFGINIVSGLVYTGKAIIGNLKGIKISTIPVLKIIMFPSIIILRSKQRREKLRAVIGI